MAIIANPIPATTSDITLVFGNGKARNNPMPIYSPIVDALFTFDDVNFASFTSRLLNELCSDYRDELIISLDKIKRKGLYYTKNKK